MNTHSLKIIYTDDEWINITLHDTGRIRGRLFARETLDMAEVQSVTLYEGENCTGREIAKLTR